jgi:hypothetical protein
MYMCICVIGAADCGAGIGRVSKHLLLPRCEAVHLVEQSPRLLGASAEYIGPDAARTTRINIGLQVNLYRGAKFRNYCCRLCFHCE